MKTQRELPTPPYTPENCAGCRVEARLRRSPMAEWSYETYDVVIEGMDPPFVVYRAVGKKDVCRVWPWAIHIIIPVRWQRKWKPLSERKRK